MIRFIRVLLVFLFWMIYPPIKFLMKYMFMVGCIYGIIYFSSTYPLIFVSLIPVFILSFGIWVFKEDLIKWIKKQWKTAENIVDKKNIWK